MNNLTIVTAGIRRARCYAIAALRRWSTTQPDLPLFDITDKLPWDRCKKEPSYVKMAIWEVLPSHITRVMWVDADTFLLRPFTLDDIPDVQFGAVNDFPGTYEKEKRRIPELGVIPASKYFNGGVWVATRAATERVFANVMNRYTEPHGGCYEQTRLNIEIEKQLGGWTSITRRFNWMQSTHMDASEEAPSILHFPGSVDRTALKSLHVLAGTGEWGKFAYTKKK